MHWIITSVWRILLKLQRCIIRISTSIFILLTDLFSRQVSLYNSSPKCNNGLESMLKYLATALQFRQCCMRDQYCHLTNQLRAQSEPVQYDHADYAWCYEPKLCIPHSQGHFLQQGEKNGNPTDKIQFINNVQYINKYNIHKYS